MKLFGFLVKRYNSIRADKHFGEIFSGSIMVFIAKILAAVISLGASVIVAQYYGAEVVGVLALINSFFAVVTVFTLLGTNTSVLRLIPEYTLKYSPGAAFGLFKKMLLLVIISSGILTLVLLFGSEIIAERIFGNPELTIFFGLASLILVFKTLQKFSLQGLRAVQNIRAFALIQLIGPLVNLLLLVVVTIVFFNKYTPVYIQLFIVVLMASISLLVVNSNFKKKLTSKNVKAPVSFKGILQISFPMFLTNSMAIFMGELTTLIAGHFLSEADVGYYATALRIAMLTTFVLQAINTVVAPKFAELFHQGLIDELFTIARKSTKLIFWSAVPLLLIFLFFGKWIIVFLYGLDFEVSYPLLLILMGGLFVNAISGSVGNFMNMCGYEKLFRNVMMISVLINIALNILLIPRIGIYGAAITTSFTQIFWNVLLTAIIYRKYNQFFLYLPFIRFNRK